ncbi:putative x-pro dipeptidyl- protein [Daldinia childiae]|uniref:putative x-pro dipeptidyl- protein n=1 Tax=Daldinia childiae TaxID=326645 RepID=UPI0014467108|nr:putative x-pro dipeptidyl- protein [Daldinia childiae]KAF3055126.1 putative x-pro dipeptidyl- protein [Daldinia childiae]
MMKRSLSADMKCKLSNAGWDFGHSRDPKKMYDLIRKIAQNGQDGESDTASKPPSPLESNAVVDDLTKEIELIEKEDGEEDWTAVEVPSKEPPPESIQDRVVRVWNDLRDLTAYYDIDGSASRNARLETFYQDELADLERQPFDSYSSQDDRVDHLLLRNYLRRARRTLELDKARDAKFTAFIEPFATPITTWCEQRRRVEPIDPKALADSLTATEKLIFEARDHVSHNAGKYSKATGHRAVRRVAALRKKLAETYSFYKDYDPLFDWWVTEPYKRLDVALGGIVTLLREVLVGVKPGDEETIVGEPIGRDGLLSDLEAEMIPYTPEELLRIAEKEYAWCEAEMIKASQQLNFGTHWRSALEHVKNLYEPPGAYPAFIRSLINEGAAYVKKHDLVTVPRIAEEAIRMTMIEAERQKVSPFFLGGPTMQMSYPTRDMAHEAKLMSLRGNNRHFGRATAFHEMIPGHHLQIFMGERHHHYRRALFDTPFFVEGWALYWEMVLWERGDFFVSAEDKIGSLFWRMHRCARILFSVRFHLGQLDARQCVDLLVNKVGHERATAEGEVRRSLGGDYSPLYQAGYMLGALQLMRLRKEALGDGHGKMREKEFHDRVLRANVMPIEMLRALVLDKELKKDFKSGWRFYEDKL